MLERAIIIVADGVGCGGAPDAAAYGDAGADTLGNMARAVGGLALPHLQRARARQPDRDRRRSRRRPRRARRLGRDARGVGGQGHHHRALGDGRAGHRPGAWRRFPNGFPPRDHRAAARARPGAACSATRPASGTAIIDELGRRAHGDRRSDPLHVGRLGAADRRARGGRARCPSCTGSAKRRAQIADRHHIGRVIARPFVGAPGAFKRTYNRRDFSLVPPAPTLLDRARATRASRWSASARSADIFAGRGLTESRAQRGQRRRAAR